MRDAGHVIGRAQRDDATGLGDAAAPRDVCSEAINQIKSTSASQPRAWQQSGTSQSAQQQGRTGLNDVAAVLLQQLTEACASPHKKARRDA